MNFCGIGDTFHGETGKTSARRGDRFIVASDGLAKHFDLIRSATLHAFLSEPKMRPDIAEDNITVIIVDVLEG